MSGSIGFGVSRATTAQVPARRFPGSPMAGRVHGVNEVRVGPAFPLAGGVAEPEPAPVAVSACPCCGQPWTNRPSVDVLMDAVQPRISQILRAIIDRPGMTALQIAGKVYADDPTGGPLGADNAVRAIICQNRQIVAAHGFKVVGRRGPAGGYTLKSVVRPDAA